MNRETSKSPTPPPRPYHHGDLRQHLVDVIRGLIETHGPDGFSVAEAARLAGVSSAAPYKHFKDRADILRAIVSDAMDRLSAAMREQADRHPRASLAAVAAIGLAYVDFARREPGVFRVMFGLTDAQQDDPELDAKGDACFGIVQRAVADYTQRDPTDPEVAKLSYMLWTVVHGHAFLEIDSKTTHSGIQLDEWAFLMEVGRRILG